MKIIHKYNLFSNFDLICFLYESMTFQLFKLVIIGFQIKDVYIVPKVEDVGVESRTI